MSDVANLTWIKFKTRQGRAMQIATHGQYKYLVAPGGFLMVSMKCSDYSTYEGQFRSIPNARAYAAEIARNGGPGR